MPRRSNSRDESMEEEPESSRKNPRRGTKPVSYSEEKIDGDDPMDVDGGDDEATENPASSDEEEQENAGKKARSRRRSRTPPPSSKENVDGPERRKSARSTKFRESMKEPSDKAFQETMPTTTSSSSKKSNNRRKGSAASDMELEDDEADRKPAKKTQRKSNKRGSQQLKKAAESPKPPARRHHHRQARPSIGHHSTAADSDFSQSDESSVDSSDVSDGEENEEEPFKIQRIIASRTEPRSAWAKICKNMNTSEIDYGSRWVQGAAQDDDDTYEERFLVKWADGSYLHVSWETEKDLTDQVEGAKTYLSTFFRKSHHGLLFDSDERCDGDYFDPAWTQVDRILEVQFPEECPLKVVKDEDKVTSEDLGIILDKDHPDFETGAGREFLVKWGNTPYSEATYEYERDLILNEIDYKDQLKAFNTRRVKPSKTQANKLLKEGEAEKRRLYKSVFGDGSDSRVESSIEEYQKGLQEHVYKNGGQLRDYQAEGVSWLMANYINDRSSILADEMGLGKTLQTASFINLIATSLNKRGPFLIVAPLSTLAHWQREFMGWTDLNTVVYHGSAKDREFIREYEISHENFRPTGGIGFNQLYLKKCLPKKKDGFVGNPWMAEVVITTPELITADDFMELTAVDWECLVVDEAQKLKNHNSKLATNLRDPKFHFGHKLLLTGTPIQNTMQELFALLSFVDSDIFPDCDEFMNKYGDMKSKDNLDSLHEEIRPFILRRLKEDVEKSVPPKEETVIEVELTVAQKQYYRALYEKNVKFLHKNKKKALDGPSLNNLGMQLRKCCNHLFLLNGIEEEFRAKQRSEGHKLSEGDILAKASGKLVLLDKLLPRLKENGHRILIFSQFKIMLDVLEDYLNARTVKFERIDGSITGKKRQQAIDRFQAPTAEGKEQPFIMLLSTRAGGVGINLTAADTCIIFDSDFNPQNDLQAQARCHRIGQTKSVKVYRLLSRQTYEMQMFHMSSLKMGLDQAVLSGFESGSSGDGALSKEEVERLLRHGAYGIFSEDKEGAEAESNNFVQQDLDTILERRARTVVHENTASKNNAGSTFSKARFSAPKPTEGKKGTTEEVSIDDPQFWQKMVGEGQDDGDEDDLAGKRRKRNVTNYSEAHYGKKVEASLRFSDAEDEDDDEESADDESYGSGEDEGQKRERYRWGGTKPSEWKKDEVKKLVSLLHAHGYGALGWSRLVSELGSKNSHTGNEVQRMCWSILLAAMCEIAEEDAAHVKRRAVRAAEKKREAGDDSPKQALGGVLAASKDDAEKEQDQESVQKCFDKLWVANAEWAASVLKDALAYAATAEPRSEELLSRVVGSARTTSGPAKKDDLSAKFAQSVWPSLKSRGWKAEVQTDGPNAGKTQYKYDGKQYYSPESVLTAAGKIHAELANVIESMLNEAEKSKLKAKETEAKMREKHLSMKAGTVSVTDLTDFLRRYAPLQIVFDRKCQKKLHFSARKMLHACSFLQTSKALVKRAERVRGSSDVIEALSASLSIDKRMSLPHPLWELKHDAVLIHAIAKHGWIDNDASCRRITQDSDIRWGFPFDSKQSDTTQEGATTTNTVREFIKSLKDTAERAATLFNDHHDILAEVKGFNQNIVIRAYSLVHEGSDENESSDERHRWVVDETALLESTGLQAGNSQECVELPTKKDLVKRIKMVLAKNTTPSGSKVAGAVVPSTNEGSQGSACVIDQSERCNVLIAEVLKAIVKAPVPKTPKAIKVLCAIATEEAQKRRGAILSASASSGKDKEKQKQAADEMTETIQKIELAKRHVLKSSRQAKNVLRVLLSIDIVKSAKDPDFPSEAPTKGASSSRKGGKEDSANGTKTRKEEAATGDRALARAMARCFDRNCGGPGKVTPEGKSEDLELTAIETLILTCIAGQGIPVWTDDMSPHFANEKSGDKSTPNQHTFFWTSFGRILVSASKVWHKSAADKVELYELEFARFEDKEDSQAKTRARRNLASAIQLETVKEIADVQAREYAAEPQILAKKVVMLVERLRRKMGLLGGGNKGKKTANSGLGPRIFDFLEEQLNLWAKNLDIVCDQDKTLSYTAADFYHDLPEADRENLEVTTHLTKLDCRMLLTQITLLTRLRSLFIKHPQIERNARITTAAKNCKIGDKWEDQPAWWGATNDGWSHDIRLLEGLVEFGFSGVLENARGFGPSTEAQAQGSLKDQGFTHAKVQLRANQLTRELHNLERSDDVLRVLDKRRSTKTGGGKANNAKPKPAPKGKGDNAKGKKKQTALESFFAKTASARKQSSVVLLSDDEAEIEECARLSAVNNGQVHIVPMDMSPKADPEGFRLKDGNSSDTIPSAGSKRDGSDSLDPAASPEKKLRSA